MAHKQAGGPSSVLMVGSVPLETSKEVFTKLVTTLPDRLPALPDGETGERDNYIGWQIDRFPSETRRPELGGTETPSPKPSYGVNSIKPTRYDDVAIASYADFVELRSAGVIPPDIRFQIGLPTPYNPVVGHCKPELHVELEPLYEQHFNDSLDAIATHIPHKDMVIQWDMCFDVIALEYDRGRFPDLPYRPYFSPVKEGLLERLQRCCEHLPADVKLAFHLCYGDLGHKHFIEPVDLGVVVEFANDIFERIGKTHAIEWLHVPVPRDRKDGQYFAPLRKLDLPRDTRLYLGLVHANDEGGTKERIDVATSVYERPFGIATECGLGRTPQNEIESVLAICKATTEPVGYA